MNKNVIITGGVGQDGNILTALLEKKKINLTILYKSKKPKNQKGVSYIKDNLSNKKKIDLLFNNIKPDIVLHLAANNPSFNEKNYKVFFKENFSATKNIFHSTFEANKKARFIFCSSSQIYQKKNGVVNEKSKTIAKTDYTKFRIKSDLMMLKYKKKEKINYTNAILFNHDSIFRKKKFILPRIVSAIIKRDYAFLKDIIKANICADFSHANDICNAIYLLIKKNIKVKNLILSSSKKTSVNSLIKSLLKKYSIQIQIKSQSKNNPDYILGENKLAKKILKWQPFKNAFSAFEDIFLNS